MNQALPRHLRLHGEQESECFSAPEALVLPSESERGWMNEQVADHGEGENRESKSRATGKVSRHADDVRATLSRQLWQRRGGDTVSRADFAMSRQKLGLRPGEGTKLQFLEKPEGYHGMRRATQRAPRHVLYQMAIKVIVRPSFMWMSVKLADECELWVDHRAISSWATSS